jgi:hypothetical protein
MKINEGELLVSESSRFECEVAIENLEGYKSLSVQQNLIQAGGGILHSEIHIFYNLILNKKFPQR